MKSNHVALTKYTIFVYKLSVVLSTDVLYLYNLRMAYTGRNMS